MGIGFRRQFGTVAGAVLVLLAVAGAALTTAQSAEAAICSAAAVTVTPMHSPDGTQRPFYGDFGNGSTNRSGYAGYELSGVSLGSDVWIKLSGFTGGKLGLAANQSASIPARATSQAGKPLVYAYLTATGDTTTAQTFTVEVWNGKPGQTGSSQVCTTTDGFSLVKDVINAGANKITSITVSNASPAIGGAFDVTAAGDTGQMGAGIAADQSGGLGVFSMAPAMDDAWPADAFTLTGVRSTLAGTTYRDRLRVYPSAAAEGAYTSRYDFTVRTSTSGATSVLPVQNIASGTQVKYTGTYPGVISQISAPALTMSLVKTALSVTGPPYKVAYQVLVSNSATSPVTLDYLRDTPTPAGPANWSFEAGSAKLGGSTISDPTLDAGALVFSGPFSVPANSSLVFTYTLAVSTTITNSVVGVVGGLEIGASAGTGNQVSVDPTAPSVTTATLPNATVGASYSQALTATAGTGTYTWSVTLGSLPAGLTLAPATGVISGIATGAGASTFTVTATDGTPKSGSKSLTLTVDAASGDTTAPTGSLMLDGGAAVTSSTTLTLGLSATDGTGVVAYRVAEGSDCTSASWVVVSSSLSFSGSASLTVSAGDGVKTACVQYKDAAGNISTTSTQTITLDTVAPTVTLASAAASPVSGGFTVTATFSESVTGFSGPDVTVGNGSVSGFSGSGTSYSFTVTPTANGPVTVDVAPGVASDAASNGNSVATQLTRTADVTRPTVALATTAPGSTNGAFVVTATFSESVTGFTASDVAVSNGALSGFVGSGATYSFTVTPATDGTVTVDVAANGAADTAGNLSTAATQLSRTYDATAPSVALASPAASSVTGAFTVTATFSESVTGFSGPDVTVGNGVLSAFAGSGTTYSFTVTPTTDGTVTVDVAANGAADAAGNLNTAATQLSRLYDATAPSVALASAEASPVSGSFAVTATFSESVTGFDDSDVTVGNGSVSGFSGFGASYSFTVTPVADGTVAVDVTANGASDAAGNLSTAATQLTRTADATRPSVALATAAPGSTNGAFAVTATFSESVTGFSAADVAVGNGTLSGFGGSGTTYSFTITPTADGTVSVDVAANGAADAAGNLNTAATQLSRLYDATAPSVALASAAASSVTGAFTVTATFAESVTGFDGSDVVVGNGALSGFSGSGASYSFTVTPVTDGAVTVDVAANGAADGTGNLNTAAVQLTRTADVSPPSVSLTTAAPSSINGAFVVTATFSKTVTGFDVGDVVVTNAAVSGFSGSGAVYTFTVTPAADGSVTIDVGSGAGADTAANGSTAAAQLARTADVTPPSVSLATAAPSSTNGAFVVTATFSEPVTGFDVGDVVVTNAAVSGFSGSGTVYTFTVTPAGAGSVEVAVGVGAASEGAGNGNVAATPLARVYDPVAPVVTFSGSPPATSVDGSAAFAFAADELVAFSCSLDAAAFGPCSSPILLTGLAAGEHTFVIRPLDLAGNTSDTTYRWTVVAPTAGSSSRVPQPHLVIMAKINPTDMLGRPKAFKQSADSPHSPGPFTRKLQVKLRVPTPTGDGIHVEQVFISNYADFRSSRRYPIAADELYDWELLAGPSGDRPVYIRFDDSPDALVGAATIVLDQELPMLRPAVMRIGLKLPRRLKAVAARQPVYCGAARRRWLRIPGVDGFSGLNAVQIATDIRHPCGWRPYLPIISYRAPGKVIYLRIEDRVGNVSRWYRIVTK